MIQTILLLPLLGAILIFTFGKQHWKIRNECYRIVNLVSLAVSVFALISVSKNGETALQFPNVLGLGLSFRLDGFRSLYITLASFMWAMTGLMSERYFQNYHQDSNQYQSCSHHTYM